MGGKRHNNQTGKEPPKPEDAGASYFKVVKHNLEKVLEDPHQYASQFNRIVKQLHLHTIYTLDFLKAWFLYNYEQNNMILPAIDQTLIRLAIKLDLTMKTCNDYTNNCSMELDLLIHSVINHNTRDYENRGFKNNNNNNIFF